MTMFGSQSLCTTHVVTRCNFNVLVLSALFWFVFCGGGWDGMYRVRSYVAPFCVLCRAFDKLRIPFDFWTLCNVRSYNWVQGVARLKCSLVRCSYIQSIEARNYKADLLLALVCRCHDVVDSFSQVCFAIVQRSFWFGEAKNDAKI